MLEGEALFRRLRGAIEEFAAGKDEAELVASWEEVAASPDLSATAARTALTVGIKAAPSSGFREAAASALRVLAGRGLLDKEGALAGVKAAMPAFMEAAADSLKLAENTAPILAPLLASGFMSAGEVAPLLDGIVGSKQGALFAAAMLASAVKAARAAGDEARVAALVSAATAHEVALVPLAAPSASRPPQLKKALELLAGAGVDAPALAAAYPEVDAILAVAPKAQAAVRGPSEASAAALGAAIEAAPAAARASPDFARGVLGEVLANAFAEACNAFAEEGTPFAAGAVERLKPVAAALAPVLRPLLAPVDAIALANTAQMAVAVAIRAAADDGDEVPESVYGDVFAALAEAGIVPADAWKAWAGEAATIADGGKAAFQGRVAALKGAAAFVAGL